MHRILPFVALLVIVLSCHRKEKDFDQIYAPFLQTQTEWADSMLLEMTLDEKIGQLLILQSSGIIATDTLAQWTWNGYLGGWMPEDISLDEYIFLTDTLQDVSRIPLMMGTRQSVAINNQFTDVIQYPSPATISALKSGEKRESLLQQYITQCKALNIHFSLTPALNMADTMQQDYDFSAMENDSEAQLFWSYKVMSQLQKAEILSVGTPLREMFYASERDVIEVAKRDSLMHQYFNLSQNGMSGMLIDNEVFRADTNRFYPVDFLTEYLQEYATFNGLAFGRPDSVNTAFDLLHGGIDLLVITEAPWLEIARIRKAVNEGFLTVEQINKKARKVLLAKSWLGLNEGVSPINAYYVEDLLGKEYHVLPIYELFEESLVLANNLDSLIPFQNLDRKYFKLVTVGEQSTRSFEKTFKKYANFKAYGKVKKTEDGAWKSLNEKLLKTSTVILTLADIVLKDSVDAEFINSVNMLSKQTKIVLVNFGSPFNLRHFVPGVTMVQVYELNSTTQSQVAQLLFGGIKAKGQLPLALTDYLMLRQGFSNEVTRLKYGLPQEVGIAPYKLVDIDAIVHSAIRSGAMPGCQVMVIKEGKVIYDKNFGHFTYDKQKPIRRENLYDIASVTKVAATSLAAMKLFESGLFRFNHKINNLLNLEKSALRKITVQDLFTHRSGLQSFLPITPYLNNKDTLVNGCNNYFCKTQQDDYNIRVADSLFFNSNYLDTLWNDIYQVKPRRRKRYLYSDLNFILLQRMIEKLSATPLDAYLSRNFYRPLNMTRTGYNPTTRFSVSEIVPTAMDTKWRKQQIQGFVHDESATLLGGVAGNAGIFSNATDMAVLFQMLLNKGTYGGKQYLKPQTVDLFTRRKRGGRGMGFEVKTKSGTGSCSPYATNGTYGHKGFTGTCVWVDPENELIYIFLTNRIYPNYHNTRLMRKKIRQRVHSVVYRALNSYCVPETEELSNIIMASGLDEKDCEEEG